MAEFHLILDGLELTEEQHALISREVVRAGVEAVGRLDGVRHVVPKGGIVDIIERFGGRVLLGASAVRAQQVLRDQGVIRELPSEAGA